MSRDMRKVIFNWIVKIDRDTGDKTNHTEVIKRFAVKIAKKCGVDFAFAAHSYRPCEDTLENVVYVNTGTINSKPYQQNSFVTIGTDCKVTLHLLKKEFFD